jgi:membrane protein
MKPDLDLLGASVASRTATGGRMGDGLRLLNARAPWFRRWWQAVGRVVARLQEHESMLVAAGCAFYATLSLFPAISMLISVYGLLFNPLTVEPQLALMHAFLPTDVEALITRQVHTLVSHHTQALGLSLILSALFTWWSASSATTSMMSALNQAYNAIERRGYFKFLLISMALTLAATLCAVLVLALLVALPAVAEFFHVSKYAKGLVHAASLLVVICYAVGLLAALYKFGPSVRPVRHHRILPGTIVATVLWLVAALLFTVYVQRIASFDATYGPLATVAGVMLWFWLSIFATLAGAELNSVLEMESAKRGENIIE